MKKLIDQYLIYPNVGFVYNPTDPLRLDLMIILNSAGMQLRFDPVSQRLKLIVVFDASKIHLSYSGKISFSFKEFSCIYLFSCSILFAILLAWFVDYIYIYIYILIILY